MIQGAIADLQIFSFPDRLVLCAPTLGDVLFAPITPLKKTMNPWRYKCLSDM